MIGELVSLQWNNKKVKPSKVVELNPTKNLGGGGKNEKVGYVDEHYDLTMGRVCAEILENLEVLKLKFWPFLCSEFC